MKKIFIIIASISLFFFGISSSSAMSGSTVYDVNHVTPTGVSIDLGGNSQKTCEEIRKDAWGDGILTQQEFSLLAERKCLPDCYYENDNKECKQYYKDLLSSGKGMTEDEFEMWKEKCCEDRINPCQEKLKSYLKDGVLSVQELIDLKRSGCLCKYTIEDFNKFNKVYTNKNLQNTTGCLDCLDEQKEVKEMEEAQCLDCLDEQKEVKKINPALEKQAQVVYLKIEKILSKKPLKTRKLLRKKILSKLQSLVKEYKQKKDKKSMMMKDVFEILILKLQ